MIPDHKAPGLHQNSPACVSASLWERKPGVGRGRRHPTDPGFRPSSVSLLAEEPWASHEPSPICEPVTVDSSYAGCCCEV